MKINTDCIQKTFNNITNVASSTAGYNKLKEVATEVKDTAQSIVILAYSIFPLLLNCDPLNVFKQNEVEV